ncbi:MAG: sigma factor-like helix-turn-helix DNA-binding protein [Propionibacteriaceae bacterium]|nr:sigma factor-like helix-turn-helix DNA-binding protein [Propionibacteriaceae bacterium]
MKPEALSRAWVVNIDQRRSRRQPDRVPAALAVTEELADRVLSFERTAGDEIQGLLRSGAPIVRLVEGLARIDAAAGLDSPGWRIGIGFGEVENVAVVSTREARGPAYLAARAAVEAAARAPAALALIAAAEDDRPAIANAEAALILVRTLLSRRSDKGWEVVDEVDAGKSQAEIAERLGVSESAVSQRLARAYWREGVRGAELASALLAGVGNVGADL